MGAAKRDHINDIDLETDNTFSSSSRAHFLTFHVKLCVERGTTMSSTIDLQAMASFSNVAGTHGAIY